SAIHAAPGTHQVAVRIDDETGDYTLVCESCDWVGERGDERLHSWRDRQLDWVLMRHVAFGNLRDAATTLPTPAARPSQTERQPVIEQDDPVMQHDPVPRRVMLSPGR